MAKAKKAQELDAKGLTRKVKRLRDRMNAGDKAATVKLGKVLSDPIGAWEALKRANEHADRRERLCVAVPALRDLRLSKPEHRKLLDRLVAYVDDEVNQALRDRPAASGGMQSYEEPHPVVVISRP